MSPDVRLAEIVAALEVAGVRCLVMGGHAVRTLVEAVRRQYRLAAQAADRADKER
jgi:hypothetical protein